MLVGGAIAIVVLLAAIVVLLVLNLLKGSPSETPEPSASTPIATQRPTATGSPTASAGPTSSAEPTSSAGPTANPATTRPTAPGTPATGYEAFLLHIPEQIRSSCVQGTGKAQTFLFNALCTSPSGFEVAYSQYADAIGMDSDYEQLFEAQQIDRDSGSCEDHATWPAEGAYQVEGSPAGRRLCIDVEGVPSIYWTDDRLIILSNAMSPTGNAAGLIEFWTNEAGPVQ